MGWTPRPNPNHHGLPKPPRGGTGESGPTPPRPAPTLNPGTGCPTTMGHLPPVPPVNVRPGRPHSAQDARRPPAGPEIPPEPFERAAARLAATSGRFSWDDVGYLERLRTMEEARAQYEASPQAAADRAADELRRLAERNAQRERARERVLAECDRLDSVADEATAAWGDYGHPLRPTVPDLFDPALATVEGRKRAYQAAVWGEGVRLEVNQARRQAQRPTTSTAQLDALAAKLARMCPSTRHDQARFRPEPGPHFRTAVPYLTTNTDAPR